MTEKDLLERKLSIIYSSVIELDSVFVCSNDSKLSRGIDNDGIMCLSGVVKLFDKKGNLKFEEDVRDVNYIIIREKKDIIYFEYILTGGISAYRIKVIDGPDVDLFELERGISNLVGGCFLEDIEIKEMKGDLISGEVWIRYRGYDGDNIEENMVLKIVKDMVILYDAGLKFERLDEDRVRFLDKGSNEELKLNISIKESNKYKMGMVCVLSGAVRNVNWYK